MMNQSAPRKSFPQCGNIFSIVWKNREKVFHTVENFSRRLCLGLALGLATVSGASEPAKLALELDAEGQREAAAIEFRRLALADENAENAGRWFWLAAHEYALWNKGDLSNRMLDRAEDVAPLALAIPVSWLRAENAMQQKDWASAAFHFDSLRLKATEDDLREFAARGSAAARLREKDPEGAGQALAAAPGDLAKAREAIDRYAAGRDKKPWLGGVLGMVPGLGYIYSGEYANAARSIILNSLFIWGMVETADYDEWGLFAVLTFAEATWYSGSIYGGIDSSHRRNERRLDAAISDVRGEKRLAPDLSQVPIFSLRFSF